MIRKGTRFNVAAPDKDGTIAIVMLHPDAPEHSQTGYIVTKVTYSVIENNDETMYAKTPSDDTVKLARIIRNALNHYFTDDGIGV